MLLTVLVLPLLLIAASAKAQPEDTDKQNTTLAQRIVQREEAYKDQLSNVSKERIAQHCRGAQSILTDFKTKAFTASDKRQGVYKNLSGRLGNIVKYLEEQHVNTADLTVAQKELNDAVSSYSDNLQGYKDALNDLISVTCISDPTGFYASLMDAREFRNKMSADASDIRGTVPKLSSALQAAGQELANAEAQH